VWTEGYHSIPRVSTQPQAYQQRPAGGCFRLSSAGVCRVVAGQWLGPWVLCKALAAAAAAAAVSPSSSLQQQGGLGLCVHVACDPGGGAPELHPDQLQQLLPRRCSSSASGAAAKQGGQEQGNEPGGQQQQQSGLLLLVPLTLGVGKVRWGPAVCLLHVVWGSGSLPCKWSASHMHMHLRNRPAFLNPWGCAVVYCDMLVPRPPPMVPAYKHP
jgi:hypothetical protein